MRILIVVLFMLLAFYCSGQKEQPRELTYENFESEVLVYHPIKRVGVSDKDFKQGVFILNETKSAVENKPENFTYADYWNIAMAFVNFDESNTNIEIAFKKAIQLDPENICTILNAFGSSELDIRIPATFYPFIKNCPDQQKVGHIDLEDYLKKNELDPDLVRLMYGIKLADAKYRFEKPVDWSKQKRLDEENQKRIDSLYNKKETYIGRSLVGKKLESTMWTVIQHSNVEMMETYLPVIQKAVQQEELSVGPLKMLIDRFYGLKYGYQVFGTQSGFGFELADEKTKSTIESKYGIE